MGGTPKLMWSLLLYKFQYSGAEECKTDKMDLIRSFDMCYEGRVQGLESKKGGFTVVGWSEVFLAYKGRPNEK